MNNFKKITFVMLISFVVVGVNPVTVSAIEQTQIKEEEYRIEKQDIDTLSINVQNSMVDVEFVDEEEYSLNYNDDKNEVLIDNEDSTLEMNISKVSESKLKWEDRVKLYIPRGKYDSVCIFNKEGGVSLSGFQTDIKVENNNGAVSIKVEKDYSGNIDYTGVKSSGSIQLKEMDNISIAIEEENSNLNIPKDWTNYKSGDFSYSHTFGNGDGKINIDLEKSTFSISE